MDLRAAAQDARDMASSVSAPHPPMLSGCDVKFGFARSLDVTKPNPPRTQLAEVPILSFGVGAGFAWTSRDVRSTTGSLVLFLF